MSNNSTKEINILFIGDIFGKPGIEIVKEKINKIKDKYNVHFVIAQAENVSGRKGLEPNDYKKLKTIGIDAFTIGNHVWAKNSINEIIENNDVIRPLNINDDYPGKGSAVFDINGISLRVTSLLGITFNPLLSPWKQSQANNFFDAIDLIIENDKSDFHFIDFHAETTSEKNVLALYLDGKVSALVGTHTHVQTADARILKNNLAYITDVGMCGPTDAAIGANFQEVYEKMRYDSSKPFKVSNNKAQFNGVIIKLSKDKKSEIIPLNF